MEVKYINEIILGNNLNILSTLPSEKFNCCVTSPPYFGLRDYGIEPVIWDEDEDCKHEWGNEYNQTITKQTCYETGRASGDAFAPGKKLTKATNGKVSQGQFCQKCGAWRGSLGLEPTIELYIKHLCDIFDWVKRVLRNDGVCFVNIGDSYSTSPAGNKEAKKWKYDTCGKSGCYRLDNYRKDLKKDFESIPAKSLCLIPQRFVIEMVNRGWIARNVLIWHKINCMPSSAKDRFTVDFEDVFFFTKNNKAIFWTNEKTLECISKNPPGTKGIEGEDWEWRECTNCQGEGEIIGKALKDEASPVDIGIVTENTKAFKVCSRCKGSGKVKYSFWTGHNYWFEQQFEEYKYPLDRWGGIYTDGNVPNSKYLKENIDPAQITKRPRNMRPNENGRNKRAVWSIPTKPFPEAHFAVYPEALIEPMIQAGCPRYVCKKCGKARVKIYKETKTEPIEIYNGQATKNYSQAKAQNPSDTKRRILESMRTKKEEIGYSDCGCNAGWEGGIVLDPFMGAGTTAVVARKQGKQYIGIEIKQEYIDMSNKRTRVIPGTLF